MFGSLSIADVEEQIDGGDKQSLMDQDIITRKYKKVVREERLSVRREWGPKRKKLKTLLAVLEMDEPKETK